MLPSAMRRFAIVALLGACSFTVPAPSASQPIDASEQGGGSDAKVFLDAKHFEDAKVYKDAPAIVGSLAVTSTLVPDGDLDLHGEGTADWAHWGYSSNTSFDHKTGANMISDVDNAGLVQLQISSVTVSASWTNGTPDATVSRTATGTGVTYPDALAFTAPAGTTSRTLHVYCGGHGSMGTMRVSLSDASAPDYMNATYGSADPYHVEFTIVYNAAATDQTVNVSWTDTGDTNGGFLMLLSATLE